MCGIFGVWNLDGAPLDHQRVIVARDKLSRRGPDDAGVMISGGVALGHRRLSIIDLSPQGRQPMANETGTIWITFNGEIYNFAELRRELLDRGHVFASQTDTEAILHGYEEWGTDCFAKLDGMFAFALWDAPRERLILVRGPHGKKPLYYHYAADRRVVFASTLNALLSWPEIPRELDVPAIYEYIKCGYFHAPHCIVQAVQKVRPGHFLIFEREQPLREVNYWNLLEVAARPKLRFSSDQECLEQLEPLLKAAVKKRLVADVPIGAFLSGGVDSSLIVALIREVSSQPIKTFSIGFSNSEFDESAYGESVANHLDVPNIVFRMSGKSLLDFIPDITQVYDEPNLDFSILPTLALARLARSEVTVALSGDGGDEFFGGYDRYQAMIYFERYFARLPLSLRKIVARRIAPWLPMQRLRRLLQLLDAPDTAAFCSSYSNVLRYFDLRDLLPPEAWERHRADPVAEYIRALPGTSPIEAAMFYDATHPMIDGILVKVDRATMHYGVEARNPLLDKAVVEFALRLPLEYKMRDGDMKFLLKKLLCRYLPKAMVYRPKMGFAPPLGAWFRNELRELLLDNLSEDSVRRRGLFQPAGVQKLLQEHLSGAMDHAYLLWELLLLELWLRDYWDR